ncbi:MAG: hypothetical protein RL026_2358 [Pseudomonadota bacterium]|jgi:hypothetical protein
MDHPWRTKATSTLLLACLALASCATGQPTTSATQATNTRIAGNTKRAAFPGFTATQRGGDTVYCQKRNPTGSRARVAEHCYTADEMRLMEENNKEYWKQAGTSSSHDTFKMAPPR